jgi:hypothetical protein
MKNRSNLIFSILMLLALSACSLGQAAATPTLVPTPLPTSTPVPTDTPVPTATSTATYTPTPLPTATNTSTATLVPSATSTATPDKKATQAALSTQAAEAVTAKFQAEMKKLGIPTDKAKLGWVQTESLSLELDTAGESFYKSFADDVSASDFIFTTDVTWTATDYIFCGFYFRSDASYAKGKHYLLEFTNYPGLPGWLIVMLDNGTLIKNVTERWRWASALNQKNDATNRFILIAEADKFTLYINGQRIGSFYDFDKTRTEGYFAISAAQQSGRGTCRFDNTQIWHLK